VPHTKSYPSLSRSRVSPLVFGYDGGAGAPVLGGLRLALCLSALGGHSSRGGGGGREGRADIAGDGMTLDLYTIDLP
jgi:hypothetical protein